MSSDWPVASALLAGRYRLVSLLETGGMAEIWRAQDELLDRPVAVKLPKGPQIVWREARMAARLSHPGIAAVHDYREAVRPDGSVIPFVVMELLSGESVAARVDRELIGWAETARIGAAVADALAGAHASGVVHRDIKPGNVMLTPNGVKILDFGISVAAGEPDDDDTGATFGTPAYVAPERLDGMPAEPATDVYGVGVLLFEMVTGDPPYAVETWEELAAARAEGPSSLPPSLPADFRDVVERCLNADPGKRPTAARLRADLLAVALRSRPAAPSITQPASSTTHPASSTTQPDSSATPAAASPIRQRIALPLAEPLINTAAGGKLAAWAGAVDRTNEATAFNEPAAFSDDDIPQPSQRRRMADTRGYTTGRAQAATLNMTPPPRRRVAVTVGAAAVLAAAAGAFATITWTHRENTPGLAVPPPVTVSIPPEPSESAPAPLAATSPAPSSPAPSATLTFADAISRMRASIEGGVAARQIRRDVGTDLLNLLQPLTTTKGNDVTGQVEAIRQKIRTRQGEGGVTAARAAVLQSRLEDLDKAAGT
jgi:serine/threonine protein kinase